MRPINRDSDRFPTDAADATELSTTLARWYAARAAIRRLWAVDGAAALTIFIALQPTIDGDDALPLWLAKSGEWTQDLTTCTRRDVELRLLIVDALDESVVEPNSAVIAELGWRDAWTAA